MHTHKTDKQVKIGSVGVYAYAKQGICEATIKKEKTNNTETHTYTYINT